MSCDLSKSSEKSYISFQLLIFVNKFFHVWQILKAKTEIVCFLSRKNCEYVCQNSAKNSAFVQKRNNLRYHIKRNFTMTLDVNFILMF
jgi:hypothetical protein